LQQVCAVEIERPVRAVEWPDDECDARRLPGIVESIGRVDAVDAAEFARTEVASGSQTARMKRERRMPCLTVRELP